MMARRSLVLVALVLALTCGPSAIPVSPSESPSASAVPIASSDLITLREGGQQSSLVVRRVATSELLTNLPDGLLLPDGRTILSVEASGNTSLVKTTERLKGKTITQHEIPGTWQLYRGYPSYAGASSDGKRIVLLGSSYNYADASGTWFARTTYSVLDLATWHIDPIELNGRFAFQSLSNDGRFAYLVDYTSQPSKARVYDVATRALTDLQGETLPDADFMPTTYVGGFAFQLFSSTESVQVKPDVIQVTPVTKLARIDLTSRTVRTARLPVDRALNGEEMFIWSLLGSADGRTLYAANPAAGSLLEIDVTTLQVRRTGHLTDAGRGPIELALAALHSVAYAKMGFGTGAAFSPDGSKLYVLGTTGIWSVDLVSLKSAMLTRDGSYETMKVSPDGKRLYVLGREDGVISAVDAQTGKLLGSMKRIAFPSEIVAVDAG